MNAFKHFIPSAVLLLSDLLEKNNINNIKMSTLTTTTHDNSSSMGGSKMFISKSKL